MRAPGTEAGFFAETRTEVKGEKVRLRSVGDNRAGVIHAHDHSYMTVLYVRCPSLCATGDNTVLYPFRNRIEQVGEFHQKKLWHLAQV